MLPYGGDIVIMNRVQIAMARKVLGWPLYTIVIAIGQASVFSELFRGMHRTDVHYRCWPPTATK